MQYVKMGTLDMEFASESNNLLYLKPVKFISFVVFMLFSTYRLLTVFYCNLIFYFIADLEPVKLVNLFIIVVMYIKKNNVNCM